MWKYFLCDVAPCSCGEIVAFKKITVYLPLYYVSLSCVFTPLHHLQKDIDPVEDLNYL